MLVMVIVFLYPGALRSDVKAPMQMPITGPGRQMTQSETEECMTRSQQRKRNEICQPGTVSKNSWAQRKTFSVSLCPHSSPNYVVYHGKIESRARK